MRRSLWLIWLCMALLPIRGLAHAGMMFAGTSAPPGVAATASAPCHLGASTAHAHDAEVVAQPAGHTAAGADGATERMPHAGSCHLCTVCHSVALASIVMIDAAAPVPATAPRSSAGIGAGLDGPDGLFRPPR